MADINDTLKNLNNTLENLKSSLEEKKEELKNATEGTKEYRDIEKKIAKIEDAIENVSNSIKNKIEATLEDIENSINESEKTATQKIKEGIEERRKFIEENVKDEKKRNQLLLGLQKEFDKKMIDQFKKTLAGENQTVFEKLNERFAEEIQLYEKGSEEAIAIQKAYNRKRAKLFLDQSQQLVSAISNLVNAGEAQLKEIEDTWGVTNQAAHDYGRAVGYNADQIKRLHDETVSWMSDNDITKQFNIGADEMFKLMGSYNQQLGRAVALTNDAKINLVSMRNVIGEEQAIKFTTNLDKFGLDVDATKDLVEGIVGDARRSGIVLSNLTQNVADNLYLAQQYTFEDGIEGLVRMAEKATAVKWNMEQTAAFAEKVNNVEGAIKTGAQLSVLGGPFAQFSNPMGMLYESLNDMEGLQDRMFAMFGSLGEWNQEKGMLDISTFNKQRIRAAASAMGLNYGEVINNVNQQARRNVVMDQIKGYGLDENTTELIANTAQIDRETGRAYVMYNNEKVFANEIGGRGDKNKILDYLQKQANSSDENLRDIAHNTLGAKEMIEAVEKEFITDRADFFRSIGISKEGVAETHEKIMYAKYGLDKVNQVLSVILGVVQAIAIASSFKGAFGGGKTSPGVGARGTTRGPVGGGGMRGSTSGTRHQVYTGKRGTMVGVDGKTSAQRYQSMYGGAWNKTRAIGRNAWSGIKSGASNFVKGGGAAMGLAVVGNIGAGYMHAQSDRLRAKGNHKDADNVNMGAGILAGAANGAAIGAMFGPWGAAIGGVVGGIAGAISAGGQNSQLKYEREKEERIRKEEERIDELLSKKKAEFRRKTGLTLKGSYSASFINKAMMGTDYLGQNGAEALINGGDGDVLEQMKPRYSQGGILKGSSHLNGGMNVVDNQTGRIVAEVEGEEGVIPKNVMEKFGSTDNLINRAMRPLQPMGEILQVNSEGNTSINSSLNVGGSANVNVGGSIQLSMPGGQTYNIAEDPTAMRMIGDSVMRHIMAANQQIFNKSEFYRKW